MEEIQGLFDNINKETIPRVLYDELCKHGDDRSSTSYTDKNGKRITKYGKLNPPFYTKFGNDGSKFRMLEKYYKSHQLKLENGLLFDENHKQLNKKSIQPYFKEYSRGFKEGYRDFQNDLNERNSVFEITNEHIAFKVYSRVIGFWTTMGQIPYDLLLSTKDFQLKAKTKFNIDTPLIATKKDYYNGGHDGGTFYKAWEIILNNPTIFESIFKKNENQPITSDKVKTDNDIRWTGTQTELIELTKALIENQSIKGVQRDIILEFSKLLNFEIKNPNKLITDIKKRNIGSETLFIDKLKTSLLNYITKENIR